MQARVLMHSQNMQNNAQAKILYTKSIDLDPAFGRAYAGYALSHALDYRYQWGASPRKSLATAVEMANIAVSLSPELPETWQARAYISLQNKDTDSAVSSIKRIFKLNKRISMTPYIFQR